ncbi:hypothetical protein RRSWK_02669 [Rhodopirellula sp. SWK7]|nr:hypothetical protein RRSWK_02669 [Rhodopirellula sp. SWK7]
MANRKRLSLAAFTIQRMGVSMLFPGNTFLRSQVQLPFFCDFT